MSTPKIMERKLRSAASALHVQVNRYVTATKRAPEGGWKHRRDLAILLAEGSAMIASTHRDMKNWQTTAGVVLRKYHDLVQGISAEPHADGCEAKDRPNKYPCTCWKSRVHAYKSEVDL
jgi:hypothetical protein